MAVGGEGGGRLTEWAQMGQCPHVQAWLLSNEEPADSRTQRQHGLGHMRFPKPLSTMVRGPRSFHHIGAEAVDPERGHGASNLRRSRVGIEPRAPSRHT